LLEEVLWKAHYEVGKIKCLWILRETRLRRLKEE
jgi:hypothetical protein